MLCAVKAAWGIPWWTKCSARIPRHHGPTAARGLLNSPNARAAPWQFGDASSALAHASQRRGSAEASADAAPHRTLSPEKFDHFLARTKKCKSHFGADAF